MAKKKSQDKSKKRAVKGSTDPEQQGILKSGETLKKGSGKSGGKGGSPPVGSAGSSDEEEHQRRLRETLAKIDTALEAGRLSNDRRQEYRRALQSVVGRLTPPALARVHRTVKEYRFYPSFQLLTKAIREKYPTLKIKPKHIVKGFLDRDGTVYLNGGGILFGRPARQEEFYAHEITHALDRPNYEISSTDEWKAAWKAEIADSGYLSEDAQRSPQEGFAEFGVLMLGSGVSAKDVKQLMPKCVKVWRQQGIL